MIDNTELQNLLANMQAATRGNSSATYSRNDLAKLLDKAFVEQWQVNRALRA